MTPLSARAARHTLEAPWFVHVNHVNTFLRAAANSRPYATHSSREESHQWRSAKYSANVARSGCSSRIRLRNRRCSSQVLRYEVSSSMRSNRSQNSLETVFFLFFYTLCKKIAWGRHKFGITFRINVFRSNTILVLIPESMFIRVTPFWYYFEDK